MEDHVDRAEARKSETASKPVGKDDLQTLPLAEVEKKLGSSPDGLTQAEAQKRVTQYGPNEIAEKKTNDILKFLAYFWGPIPWMIEVAVILSAVAPLAGLRHNPPPAPRQRNRRTSGKNVRRATRSKRSRRRSRPKPA